MKKTFDFDHPDFKRHRPVIQEYLKSVYKTPTTEDQFVSKMKGLRQDIHGQTARDSRNPSHLRHEYQRLKYEYGFFV